MIIIIEGPDGTGKTSLARDLVLSTGYYYEHFKKPNTPEEHTAQQEAYKYFATQSKNAIIDRCWYSEIVYGAEMRDQSSISFTQMWEYEMLIQKNAGGIIVHCTGDAKQIWDRLQKRGEEYVTSYRQLQRIKAGYDTLFNNMQHYLPITTYDIGSKVLQPRL